MSLSPIYFPLIVSSRVSLSPIYMGFQCLSPLPSYILPSYEVPAGCLSPLLPFQQVVSLPYFPLRSQQGVSLPYFPLMRSQQGVSLPYFPLRSQQGVSLPYFPLMRFQQGVSLPYFPLMLRFHIALISSPVAII